MSTAAISGLNSIQIGTLTTGNFNSLTTSQIAAISTSGIKGLSTAQLANLSSPDVNSFTSTQLGAMTSTQLAALDGNASYSGTLTTAQAAALTATGLAALNPAHINTLLNSADIQALSTAAVVGFTTTQLNNLSTANVNALSSGQIAQLSAIQISSFSITAAQALHFGNQSITSALALLNMNTGIQNLSITDTAQNITTNFDSLQSKLTKISSITQSDPNQSIALTASKVINDADVISKLGANAKIDLRDTNKNILGNLYATYQVIGNLPNSTLTATDPQNNTVTESDMNMSQYSRAIFTDNSAVNSYLSKFTNVPDGGLTITGVTLFPDPDPSHSTWTNSWAQTFSQGTKIGKVVLAANNTWRNGSAAGNAIPGDLYSDYIAGNKPIMSKIFASDGITPARTSVAYVPSLSAAVDIMGDSAQINIGLDPSVTSGSVTYQNYSNSNFRKIGLPGGFQLTITDVPASQVATVLSGNNSATRITVSDSASNIAANFDSLHANLSNITSITQSDPNQSIALTASKVINDADVISKLGANAKIDLRDTNKNILGNLYATYQVIGNLPNSTLTATDPQNNTVTESDLNMGQYSGVIFPRSAVNSYLSKFTNALDGSFTITGVTLFPDPDPTQSTSTNSWAQTFSQITKIGKVVLAANNTWRNGSAAGNAIPWDLYSDYIAGNKPIMSKIFASDGITPATTGVSDVTSLSAAVDIMGDSAQIIYIGLDPSVTSGSVTYQNYSNSNFNKIGLSPGFLTVTGVPNGVTINDSRVRSWSH